MAYIVVLVVGFLEHYVLQSVCVTVMFMKSCSAGLYTRR